MVYLLDGTYLATKLLYAFQKYTPHEMGLNPFSIWMKLGLGGGHIWICQFAVANAISNLLVSILFTNLLACQPDPGSMRACRLALRD